ncbi:MAG: phosphoribosyl-AMP cyclohydrolase [Elusimicrobiota bacterium]
MDLNNIKFTKDGLIPCVTQDFNDGRVLMVAYMNRESLEITIKEKMACYYSRSRNKLWLKGEESGNIQKVKEIYTDCDMDTILLKVEQVGDCSCHEGYRSCFFRKWNQEDWEIADKKIKDPKEMYNKEK